MAADTLDEPGAMTRVRQVYATLTGEVWPHESAEEDELYPSLNRVLGGADPTAPMSRAHAEIAYQIARLGRLTGDIGDRDPDASQIADLRSALYGLHAILRLHTVQEDETYLSLGDSVDTHPADRTDTGGGRRRVVRLRRAVGLAQARELKCWRRGRRASAAAGSGCTAAAACGSLGEYERAFYGGQYASMVPLFEHYGIQLWMPEVGGRVDWHAEDHEQTMLALGLSSKREITRTRIRCGLRRPGSRAGTWAAAIWVPAG